MAGENGGQVRLNDYDSRNDLLIDWMLEVVVPGCTVLDVGANDGTFCPEVKRIAAHVGRMVGVDPDRERLIRNPFVSERYFSTLEDAELPSDSFDALYSFFVLEHVPNEDRFIAAASRALKPGGSFFFITPNGWHYFSILSSLFAKLRIQRRVLGWVRSASFIESYHYPAVYRINSPKVIERIGNKYGFGKFEYRYCEHLKELSSYFPTALKPIPWLWERLVASLRREDLLVNLMGRMIKDG